MRMASLADVHTMPEELRKEGNASIQPWVACSPPHCQLHFSHVKDILPDRHCSLYFASDRTSIIYLP